MLDRQRRRRRSAAQVVDVLGDREGVLQLLLGMRLEFLGNRHVLGALQHLRVDHIRDDGLVFAREIRR